MSLFKSSLSRTDQSDIDKKQSFLGFSLFGTTLFSAAGIVLIIEYFSNQYALISSTPLIVGLGLFICAIGVFIIANAKISNVNTQTYSFLIVNILGYVLFSSFIDTSGSPFAFLPFIFTLLFSAIILKNDQRCFERSIIIGIFGTLIVTLATTLLKTSKLWLPWVDIAIFTLLIILILTYAIFLFTGIIQPTIRVRLISIFSAIVFIPLIIIIALNLRFTRFTFNTQNQIHLDEAINNTRYTIDGFLSENITNLKAQSTASIFKSVLLDPDLQSNREEVILLRETLTSFEDINNNIYLTSYALLDVNGKNIQDTYLSSIGASEADQEYFIAAMETKQPYISNIIFESMNFSRYGDAAIIFSVPILDDQSNPIGVLRTKYNALVFQNLIEPYSGLFGDNSYPLLINHNMVRIADTYDPSQIFYPISEPSMSDFNNLINTHSIPESTNPEMISSISFLSDLINEREAVQFSHDIDSIPDNLDEIGILSPIKSKPWTIVYIQRQDNLQDMLQTQNRQLSLVAMITATIIGFLSIMIARRFSEPIQNLTQTAEIITQGDFSVRSAVTTKDEIGTLSQTFNQMTTQLNDLINELEDRVAARTKELEVQNEKLSLRSHQLETVSDIARNINSALDLEELLEHIANIISTEFNFYHVGIFLLDDQKNYAVLQAANSTGGKRMLARHHRLAVGQTGIVGYVTGHAAAKISTDVGEDSVYYNNPDLPETRSEMALPLISAGEVIGAIDVQSKNSNAFSDEDVQLFSILAEQVAIAITNNRLYQETSRALNEIRKTHKKYLSEEWNQTLSENVFSSYQYTAQGIQTANPISLSDFDKVFETGQIQITSIDTKNPDDSGTIMTVPILIRGEVIGVIRIKDSTITPTGWKNDDLQAVKEISNQLGLALENIRLFEKTEKRAQRERKALEITSKIRSTTDINKMVQIAVDELQNELHANHVQVIFKQSEN